MPIQLPIVNDETTPANLAGEPMDTRRGKYSFVSLGCPKNLVDSERMLGLLNEDGYELVQEPEASDFVVINTCGFIDSARAESMSAIDEALELKRTGKVKGVLVAGCLAERQREKLLEARPELDGMVGVFGRDDITTIADRLMNGLTEQRMIFKPAPIRALADTNRLQVTPKHFAYLKISEGCDRLCTFCAIPKMRGKHASKPIDAVIEEAKQLADNGVRELVIVAQDTTFYHIDIDGQPRLSELLEKLNAIEGFDWIRLMYFYPMYIDQNLVDTMRECQRILPYVDIPLQHINNTMLKRMSRRVNREKTVELLDMMREGIPNLAIRTTFIAGFPGETQEHVDELAEFITAMKFQRAGVFTYSLEPDTPAARLDGHLDEDVKNARREQLMLAQQANAFKWCNNQIGSNHDVILDKAVEGQENVWIGRSYADAPDVDGVVYVTGTDEQLQTGRIVPCEIVATNDYDLVGVAVGNSW